MLKSKLLQTGVFIDNVHLNSYVSIVEEGLYKKHKKDVTERHHILPVSYRGKTHAFDGTKNRWWKKDTPLPDGWCWGWR